MDEIKYEIRGVIVDNYGNIIEGATVTIKYQNNEKSTTSSNSGQFIFTSTTTPFIKDVDNSLITLTFTKDKFKSLTITLPPPTQTPTPILPKDPTTTDPIKLTVLDEIYYVYKVGDIEFKNTNVNTAKKKAYNYYLN